VQSRGMNAPPCYVTALKIRHLERHANGFNLILIRAVIDRLMKHPDYCCIPLHSQLVRRLVSELCCPLNRLGAVHFQKANCAYSKCRVYYKPRLECI
jgi:hypothetical protein